MPDKRLKLLVIAPSARLGGQEAVLLNLASCMTEHNIEITVVALRDGPLLPRIAVAGVPVRVLAASRTRYLHRFARTVRRLGQVIQAEAPDVIYSNMPLAHVYAAIPARRQRIPAIWCQAGLPSPPGPIDRVATALPAHSVICVSRAAAATQQRLKPGRRVQLMHPGIDMARFTTTSKPSARLALGCPDAPLVSLIGRLQPWKGQREFLQAAQIVLGKRHDTQFAVVGGALLGWEGDYPQELQLLAREFGIAGQVSFTGHVDDAHLWSAASDIVVHASAPEPFGLVVVEAMASGAAVVAVDCGGPRDIIEDGVTGLLRKTREPADLARSVLRLLDDPTLASKIAAAGKASVLDAFSRERMVARFAQIVWEAALGPGR